MRAIPVYRSRRKGCSAYEQQAPGNCMPRPKIMKNAPVELEELQRRGCISQSRASPQPCLNTASIGGRSLRCRSGTLTQPNARAVQVATFNLSFLSPVVGSRFATNAASMVPLLNTSCRQLLHPRRILAPGQQLARSPGLLPAECKRGDRTRTSEMVDTSGCQLSGDLRVLVCVCEIRFGSVASFGWSHQVAAAERVDLFEPLAAQLTFLQVAKRGAV